MDIHEFIATVPASFSKHLRELADLIDARERVVKNLTDMPDSELLKHLRRSDKREGSLNSQSEILEHLKRKGFQHLHPKRLSQQLKQMGFHYTDEPVWYASLGRPKRGFWCEFI